MSILFSENEDRFWLRYEVRLTLLFLILLIIYLLVAAFYHAPWGYYGTIEAPRFADPWIARTETILSGGLLYRDVFTTTPPITNLLIILPSLVPIYVGNINPWATGAYMVYFSLFNLFTAWVLLRMGKTRRQGFLFGVLFLLNPLTFGNTVLRRQDESLVVFFIAVGLLFLLRPQHIKAAVAIGAGLLVKLSAGILLPVAFLHSRNWRYLAFPGLVFLLGMLPFFILVGQDAIFWNFNTGGAQHPFQYRGVSLPGLWNLYHAESGQVPLQITSALLVIGAGLMTLYIAWRRPGILQSVVLLITVGFLLSPKLHTGYFSIVVLALTPLLRQKRDIALFMTMGIVAMVADFYKWPIVNYEVAFWLMVVTMLLLTLLAILLCLPASTKIRLPAFMRHLRQAEELSS